MPSNKEGGQTDSASQHRHRGWHLPQFLMRPCGLSAARPGRQWTQPQPLTLDPVNVPCCLAHGSAALSPSCPTHPVSSWHGRTASPPPPLTGLPPPPCNLHPLRSPPLSGIPSLPSQYLLRWFVLPICLTHGLTHALLSHYFKSITHVCSVIFSLQRRCGCVVLLFQTQDVFSR